jgi:hypothetical protein
MAVRISPQALRIIDVNCNRTREALRVVEDILRFYWGDRGLCSRLKKERHVISTYCDRLLKQNLKGLKARDVCGDPGRGSMLRAETTRHSWSELMLSNFRRAEESLRVLEEVSKLLDPRLSGSYKRARFRVYELERACLVFSERQRARH